MADRTAAAGGGLFVVASLVAGPLLPKPPAADATAAELQTWYVQHHDAIVTASLMSVVGALGLLVLVAGLRQRSDGTLRGLVSLGGGLLVTMGVLGGLLQTAAAQAAGRLAEPGPLTALWAVERAVFFDGPAVTAVLLLAAAAGTLPRWLGAFGVAVGLLGLVSGLGDLGSRSGFPAAFGLGGFLLTVVWVALTSVTVGRDGSVVPGRQPHQKLAASST